MVNISFIVHWRIENYGELSDGLVPSGMRFQVFHRTACRVAMVFSNATPKSLWPCEWARNRAANKSPVPVNAMPFPIIGIDMAYLVRSVATSDRFNYWYCCSIVRVSQGISLSPVLWLRNPASPPSAPNFDDEMTTVLTPLSWNQLVANQASLSFFSVIPLSSSTSNWFGVQISLSGIISSR